MKSEKKKKERERERDKREILFYWYTAVKSWWMKYSNTKTIKHQAPGFQEKCVWTRMLPIRIVWDSYIRLTMTVPAGSPSRGRDVSVHVKDINQPSLPTPFYPVLVSYSVFMALSTVFHSINSPDNSPLSHSFSGLNFLPYWSVHLSISLWKSP